MSIASMRARALAHNATLRWRYPVCLDDDRRAGIDQLAGKLAELHRKRDRIDPDAKARTMSDVSPRAALDAQIAAAEEALAEAELGAAGDTVQVVFRRMTASEYAALCAECTTDGELDHNALGMQLPARTYVGCEDADGADLGIGAWSEAEGGFLSSGDVDQIAVGLVGFNRVPAQIPFSRASSGGPATS